MKKRDKLALQHAFLKVKKDVHDVNKRLDLFESEIGKTIQRNMQELKDKLADGTISAHEYDERAKRILHYDFR